MPDNFNENNNIQNVETKPEIDQSSANNANVTSFQSTSAQQDSYSKYPGSNSYAYVSENSARTKTKKNHPILKSIAFVLCLAIVGVGSIQGYRIYQDHKDKNGFSEYDESRREPSSRAVSVNKDVDDDDDEPSENNEPAPSLIELAGRKDAKPIPDIVDEIMPSVVGVSATFEYTYPTYDMFGFGMGTSQPEVIQGMGTGIIFSEDGYIVTNAHCVYEDSKQYQAGEAVDVSVRFSDESEHKAKIIAYDTDSDIAVLKVNETGLKPAVFGQSDDLRVGELVIAVGNPLSFNLFGSVTSGIVSALNRKITVNDKQMNLIQTDAPINSGNSGGPLLNSCGQVIGINSAKMSSSYGMNSSVEGLGFAIPISDAKIIIDDLINYNYVKGRPQLGISTIDVSESDSRRLNIPLGAYIVNIVEGSAADMAGLKVRDIIIDINGETINSTTQLASAKNKYKAGDVITVTVFRGGEEIKFDITLAEDTNNSKTVKDGDRLLPAN